MSLIQLQLEGPVVMNRNTRGVRILATAPGRPCPVCSTDLSQALVDRTSILFCPGCHGMAIPAQSLQTVVEKRAAHAAHPLPPGPPPDLSASILCPSCKGPMDRNLHRSDAETAVIDTCDHCRLNWLECGQLDRITLFANLLTFTG